MDSRCCCSGSSERPRSRSSETPVQSAPSTVIPDQSEGKTGLLPGALAKPLAASLPSVSTPPPPYSPPAGCHPQLGGQLPRGLLLTSIPHISMPPGLPLAVGAGSACTLGNRDLLGIVTPRMTCGQWEGRASWVNLPASRLLSWGSSGVCCLRDPLKDQAPSSAAQSRNPLIHTPLPQTLTGTLWKLPHKLRAFKSLTQNLLWGESRIRLKDFKISSILERIPSSSQIILSPFSAPWTSNLLRNVACPCMLRATSTFYC